jgi:hypothetical protein
MGAGMAVAVSGVESVVQAPAHRDLVRLCAVGAGADRCTASPADALLWSRRDNLASVGLTHPATFDYRYPGGRGRVAGARVSPELFDVLGVEMELGHRLRGEDSDPARSRPAVLAHAWWKTEWNGDPTVIGRELMLDDETYTVVGVLAADPPVPGVDGMDMAQVWTPLPDGAAVDLERGYRAVGLLSPDGSVDAARKELTGIAWVQEVDGTGGSLGAVSLFGVSLTLLSLGWVALLGRSPRPLPPQPAGERVASRPRSRNAA